MKIGTDLQTLADRIIGEAKSKKDYAIDTRSLEFTSEGLQFAVGGTTKVIQPTNHCMNQIGTHVGIPAKYFDKMQAEAPQLLAQNVNHWFKANPQTRMLRTIQNGKQEARAFLSKRYRPLDNYDLVNVILPRIQKQGYEIMSAELTDTRLYIQAVTPKLTAEVKKGDVVQSGIVISNSEVGAGSIRVEPLLYRLVCSNGMIRSAAMKRHHVGKSGDGEWLGDAAYEVLTDKTRELDDRAFWAKVGDVVDASFNELAFNLEVKKMLDSTHIDTGSPVEAVEIVTSRYGLREGEKDNVLKHLASGGDLSLWGLANAITRTAQDCESYDRAVDLERFGGQAIELPQSVFTK